MKEARQRGSFERVMTPKNVSRSTALKKQELKDYWILTV
jgi:hypothetical protein